ncbi:MAG: hypothetical protein HYY22_05285 [Thaumarchaeota archaeon]|nr:hypothetical protein [Nitrososphaerota archaeon]
MIPAYPLNGILLELSELIENDILSKAIERAQGVFVSRAFLPGNLSRFNGIKQLIGDERLLILDLRLEHPSIEDYQGMGFTLRSTRADAITVMGIYGKESITTEFQQIKKNIVAVVDIGTQFYRTMVPDKAVVSSAITARDYGCRSVLMTSLFPDRIKKVREKVGNGFEIIASKGEGLPIGEGLKAGANLEIVPSNEWS